MSQIGFGESATPNIPLHADLTATSDPHRPWTNSVHESLEPSNLVSTPVLANLENENIAIIDSSPALQSGGGSGVEANQELLQELSACNQKCHQAYTLLQQAQEQLRLSQLVIQRQEALIASLQERIGQQESMLKESHHSCDDLRDRLKRQQHHTSQLKAALERCLENDAKQPKTVTMPNSWGITKLAEERILPMVNEPTASVDQIPPTITLAESSAEQRDLGSVSANVSLLEADNSTANLSSGAVAASSGVIEPITESNKIQNNIQTVETPATVVKNPFPPRLSDHLGLLHTGVPELPTWQNPLHQPAAEILAPSLTKATTIEPLQVSQMSAYPAPLAMPQVNVPKFLRHLGESTDKDEHRAGTDERLSQGLVTRRGVSSMAAVQLPQFPPIRRR